MWPPRTLLPPLPTPRPRPAAVRPPRAGKLVLMIMSRRVSGGGSQFVSSTVGWSQSGWPTLRGMVAPGGLTRSMASSALIKRRLQSSAVKVGVTPTPRRAGTAAAPRSAEFWSRLSTSPFCSSGAAGALRNLSRAPTSGKEIRSRVPRCGQVTQSAVFCTAGGTPPASSARLRAS